MTFEQLIEEKRPCLEQIIADLSRQHFLAPAETDEFRKVVERALERHDYELLRAFDGRCTWETYLHTVLTREFFTFQAALWGDWRPSGQAMRLGAAAMLLEELVCRDRFSVTDAIEWMRTAHRVDQPRHRLRELAVDLGLAPAEQPARRGLPPVAGRPAADAAVRACLEEAMALLTPDDRLILELRFRDHQPLTRIARLLKVEARPLQRRIDAIKLTLADSLGTQGVSPADVEQILRVVEGDLPNPSRHWWNFVYSRPSKQK